MTDTAVPAAKGASAPAEASISLTEFCMAHSKVERSVELLNAFFTVETVAGRDQAPASAFITRLAAFAAQPTI